MLVLRNARIWDGVHEELRAAEVVCEGGLIRAVHAPGTLKRPTSGTVVVDLDGATVLPGLIDAHLHLVWSGGDDPAAVVDADGPQITLVRAVENARTQLHAGVTTVRDLGSNWDLAIHVATAAQRGLFVGPTVIASGRTVVMTGGHDPFWGLAGDGVDAVVRNVRTQVALGAGVIKTAATGGVYGVEVGESTSAGELSHEELVALTTEAHRRGRRVAVHALGAQGIRDAVRAGVDTVEHGAFLEQDVAELMAAQGTVLSPTLTVYQRIAAGNAPDYAVVKAKEVTAAHGRAMAMAIAAGIPIIAGTDAGSPGVDHPSIVDEILALSGAGLGHHEALRAATARAADAIDQPRRGRILPDAVADFVILEGDPLDDPGVLRSPWAVVKDQTFVRNDRDRS